MTPHPRDGWHWREWGSELAGTGLLMFAVVSAWYWCVVAGPPLSEFAVRVPVLSLVAGGVVVAVAYGPLGRRSGAHLNPAVTVGLWLQRSVSASDLVGYVIAQMFGGVAGFALGRIWGARVAEAGIRWAQIKPDPQLPVVLAALVEVAATAAQLSVVFWMLRVARLAPWAGVAGGALLAVGIATLAGISGAGFNPVRGLGPDLVGWSFPGAWIYVAGPFAGAALAALLTADGPAVKTGKLHHDPTQPCYLRCELPHDRASANAARPGQERSATRRRASPPVTRPLAAPP